jgi:hypothetical protein
LHQIGDAAFKVVEFELQRALQSVNRLTDVTADKTGTSEQPIDRDAVKQVLATLVQQIADYDTSALETIENSSGLFITGFLKSESILMKKAMEAYDFETAQAVIEKMQGWIRSD